MQVWLILSNVAFTTNNAFKKLMFQKSDLEQEIMSAVILIRNNVSYQRKKSSNKWNTYINV